MLFLNKHYRLSRTYFDANLINNRVSIMYFVVVIIVFLSTIFTILYKYTSRQEIVKIAGIYTQPGPWYNLKFVTAYNLIWLKKIKERLFPNVNEQQLETLQSLSIDEKGFDAVFFQGISPDGIYMCGGVERRHAGKASAVFYLLVPDLGLLESTTLPQTLVDADLETILDMKSFGAGGIKFQPLEPMKKWSLSYKGTMKVVGKPGKVLNVVLDGFWTSELPYFLLERDIDTCCLAKALAKEPWTRAFFNNLESTRIAHYEQMGRFNGILTVDSATTYNLCMDAFREHNFGYKFDWSLMHRYIYHILYLADGTRISFGVISQKNALSELIVGYVSLADKIYTIQRTNLQLYRRNEEGNPEKEYAFLFRTSLGSHKVHIKVIHEAWHYKGNDVEAKLLERFVECDVNNVRGRGICEWHYNAK